MTHVREQREATLEPHGLKKVPLIAMCNLGSKYQALKRLQPGFYADDLWKHCREARDAGIEKVFRMHGGHDGGGSPIPDVPALENLGGNTAWR